MNTTTRNIQVLLTANHSDLRSGLTRAARDVDQFNNRVQASNASVMSGGNLLRTSLAAGAAAAAVGLAYASSKAIEFDKAMRNVNSLTGLAAEEFANLEAQVIDISKTLPQSAVVLAEGLYDISSSGFTGAEGITVLKSAAEAASAGLTTTATSAKAITAVLNAYGLQASDAADVSDTLFQTVNLGVLSFEELAGSIGDVVGIAAPMKIGVDELGAAIATMTLQGVSGSESTTLLTNLFTKMIRPSEALSTKMKELGYESGEAMLSANGLRGSMDLLREATGGNITALMELFPDIQAARGALSLMSNEGQTYAGVAEKITDKTARAGATQRTLAEQMKAVANQATLAKNKIDAQAISLGVKLLPVLLKVMEASGDVAGVLRDSLGAVVEALNPTWQNLGETLESVWDILVDLGQAVGPLAQDLGTLAVGGVVVALNSLTEVLALLAGLIADNEVAALALAIALSIQLMGGLAAVTTRIGVGLVMALANTLAAFGAASTAAAGLGAALTTTAVLSAAATAGISAVLASLVIGFTRAGRKIGDLEDAIDAVGSADGLAAQVKALGELGTVADETLSRIDELRGRSLGFTILDLPGNIEALRYLKDGTEESAEAAAEAADQYEIWKTSVNQLAESGFKPGTEAANEFHNSAVLSGKAFNDMLPELEAAGVNVGDSFELMQGKLKQYRESTSGAGGATKEVVNALGSMAAGAKDVESALDELNVAFDKLMGVFMSSDEATSAFEASLDDLNEVVKKNIEENGKLGRTLDLTTEAGRTNAEAVRGMVSNLREQIEAGAAAGEGSDVLAQKLETGRQAILDAAEAAGINAGEMQNLLDRYNLTPELVQTLVSALGIQPTKAQLAELQAKLDAADDTVVTPTVDADTEAAKRKVDALMAYIRSRNGSVRISGINGSAGGLVEADGGVVSYFANGGLRESHVAQIAPAGAMRVWAEPETGGEAYIPLSPRKRERSMDILSVVANTFGMKLEKYADGGGWPSQVVRMPQQSSWRPAAVAESRAAGGGITSADLARLVATIRKQAPAVGSLTVQHNSTRASAAQIVDEAFHQGSVARLGGRR